MPKAKIKIREIKKRIKVTELAKEEDESLEEVVDIDSNAPLVQSSRGPSSPTLAQNLDSIAGNNPRPISSNFAPTQQEREESTAVNYATSRSSSRLSYDSSIRETGNVSPVSESSQARVNPTINPSGEVVEQTNRSRFDLNRRDNSLLEGADSTVRRLQDSGERVYSLDNERKYEERRRNMMM